MYILLLILYSFIILFPFYYSKRNIDLFSPQYLFSILTAFYTIPFLIYAYVDNSIINSRILFLLNTNVEGGLLVFMAYQSLFTISYYWGYYCHKKSWIKLSYLYIAPSTKRSFSIYLLLTIFSLCIIVIFIASVGGIDMLILGFTNRDRLLEGNQLLKGIASFLINMAGCFYIVYTSKRKSSWNSLGIIVTIISAFIVLAAFGGRSPFLLYIITIACAYNYIVKPIKLFSLRMVILYLVLIIFIMLMPLLRRGTSLQLDALSDNMYLLCSGNEYVNIQLLIINYFEKQAFYIGETFKNIFYIFTPRSFFPNKPPIDDGTYIYNMFFYSDVYNVKNLVENSWPPGTIGIFYANFGIIGLVLGGGLLGIFHKEMKRCLTNSRASILILYFYCFVVVKFQITTYYIANLLYTLFFLVSFAFVYKLFNRSKL